jgi:hypothetical protein
MKYASRRNVIAGAGLVAAAAVVPGLSPSPAASVASSGLGESTYNVLVFSKTAGFRHGSIPGGVRGGGVALHNR